MWGSMMESVSLSKGRDQSSPSLPELTSSYEDTARGCQPGRAFSPGVKSASTWILDLSCRTVRDKSCSSHPVYGILL